MCGCHRDLAEQGSKSVATQALVACVVAWSGWLTWAAPTLATQEQQLDAQVLEIARRYSELQLDLHPLTATRLRISGRDHLLPPPLTTAQVEEVRLELEGLLVELVGVGRPAESPQLQLEFDALRWELSSQLDLLRFPGHLLAVNSFTDSAPFALVQLVSPRGAQPFETIADFEAWSERLEALPAWVDGAIRSLREGIERGVVLSRPVAQSTLGRLDGIVASPQRPLERPLRLLHERDFAADEAKRLEGRLRKATRSANRALRRLSGFLRATYLPKSRSEISWQTLPDGDAWYRALVRRSTTTDLEPEELLELGLREAKRIVGEMKQLAHQLGHESVAELYAAVDRASLRAVSADQVLEEFARVERAVRPKLVEIFPQVPESAFAVQQVTASEAVWGPGNVYRSPSLDGRVPGVFYALIGRRYALSNVESLFLHEGLPGHHFQIALALESDLPLYRKTSPWTAFVEGWGLYAESLGDELGLYGDPMQQAGRLSMELLRAARLVLDTGIHAGGWTPDHAAEQARTQLLGSGEREVLRYAAIPAQALGYKVGERRLLKFRTTAETSLGGAFDLRAFHGAVLGAGPLPLDLLELEVSRRLGIVSGSVEKALEGQEPQQEAMP